MLKGLIECVRGVVDLTERRGQQVVSKAIYKAHYGNVLGVFWYNLLDDELDYKVGSVNHDQFERYDEYRYKNGMVRGRLVRDDNTDKNYVLIYTGDFEQHVLSGDVANNIFNQVSDVSKINISYIVDELGQDLIEKNLHLVEEK
jgi:hypothetical protein